VAAAVLLGAGFAAGVALANDAALAKYPGAKEQIMSYYAANAREGSGNCGPGHMNNISDVRVVSEDANSVVLGVKYEYSATELQSGAGCSGIGDRDFTVAKTGGAVSAMTGQTP